MATASASTLVSATKRLASSGSVRKLRRSSRHAFGTVAIFLVAQVYFKRTQHTDFAFDRRADHVGEARHFRGDAS